MVIVGITGTHGAGKGTVTDYFINKKEFKHYSARTFIVDEIKKRDLPVDRDSMREVSNDLRKQYSSSYVIDSLLEKAKESKENVIIESVRTVGEAEVLQKAGAVLIAVDADQKKRYERIVSRNNESDNVSFVKFIEQEEKEMQSEDPAKQNISNVMKMADIQILNNGTVEEFEMSIEKAFIKQRGEKS